MNVNGINYNSYGNNYHAKNIHNKVADNNVLKISYPQNNSSVNFKGFNIFKKIFRPKPSINTEKVINDITEKLQTKIQIPQMDLQNPSTLIAMFGGSLGVMVAMQDADKAQTTVKKAIEARNEIIKNYNDKNKPSIEELIISLPKSEKIKLPNSEIVLASDYIKNNSGEFIKKQDRDYTILCLDENADFDLVKHFIPDVTVDEMSGKFKTRGYYPVTIKNDRFLKLSKDENGMTTASSISKIYPNENYYTKSSDGKLQKINCQKLRPGDEIKVANEIPVRFAVLPKGTVIINENIERTLKNSKILIYNYNNDYQIRDIDEFVENSSLDFIDDKSKTLFEQIKENRVKEIENIVAEEENKPIKFTFREYYNDPSAVGEYKEMPLERKEKIMEAYNIALEENPALKKYKDVDIVFSNWYKLNIKLSGAGKEIEVDNLDNYIKDGEVHLNLQDIK